VKGLVDTCVLAELRRPEGNPAVKSAIAVIPDDDLYLSVLIVGEIAKGVALLATGRKKKALTAWLNGLETQFADRLLVIDGETARIWGEITARAQKNGEIIPAVDGLLDRTFAFEGQ
jgi:toxin FitB